MITKVEASNDIVFYIAHLKNGYRSMANTDLVFYYK